MRYFISIDVEDEGVKEELVKFTKQMESLGDIKTVRPENLHITLLYLGNLSKSDMDEVVPLFTRTCESLDVDEFTCKVSGVGVFPHMNYIKVVWAGAEPGEKLDKLHMKFSELINAGDEEDFVPHITIGRVGGVDPDEKRALKERIESHPADFGSFEVKNVRLKSSELSEDGPVYRDVEVCPL